MLKTESLKKYIDEVIAEIENELDEATATGNIAGYETPNAFSDGSDATKRRKKKIATQLGMQLVGKVESVNESLITEKQFKGLEGISATTPLTKITKDQKLKIIKGVGNIIDFIVPKGVSRNFWQVIGTGKIKKNLSGEYYLEGKVINSPMFKSMDELINGVNWKSMEERRRFNESVNEKTDIKWQDVEVGDAANVKSINKTGLVIKTYGRKFHLKFPNGTTKTYDANELTFIKTESVNEDKRANILNIDFNITEKGNNIFFAFKDKKEGSIKVRKIGSNKIVNFIQDVLDKTYGKGSYFFKSGKNAEFIGGYEFGRNPNNNNIDKLKFESVNENRWLELKNDDSMHANKKLAVGLKELKNQLSEVEKFFRWYNQIKTMNELDSDQYWKRTNSHIYKIKERIINIARTLQEIEK